MYQLKEDINKTKDHQPKFPLQGNRGIVLFNTVF